MDSKQAREFIAKYPQAKSFVKPSHLEELSPLLEVHIEAIEVTKAEFHDLKGSYMPHKETLDKFAAAAGVSYNTMAESTRKDSESCYVGRSQAMTMGPDGKMVLGDVCEYEFDVDVRLEEMKLNGKTDWVNGQKTIREYTPKEAAQERIQLLKVARQRANTGARNRATVSVLGMQTGFKGLFDKNDRDDAKRVFLFSRIIINAKNELVMNRMLDKIGDSRDALFGPAAAPRALPAAAAAGMPEDQPFRNATPAAGADPFGDSLEPEDPAPAAGKAPGAQVDPRVEQILQGLVEWAATEGPAAKRAQAIIDRGESDLRVLEASLAIIKYIASGKLKQNGLAKCLETLDAPMMQSDPVILENIAAQAKQAFDARTAAPAAT